MRSLVIEDDTAIGSGLKHALAAIGITADWVSSGPAGSAALRDTRYSFVLLDLGLPGLQGMEILKALRGRQDPTPVLIVTARDDVASRVAGLDAGADDFVVKPFDFDELAARVRAVLRRQQGRATSLIECGALTLDLATHEVAFGGVQHSLPAREFALLAALAERPGAILSRSQLEERLYGWGEEVESNAVDVLIHYIRRKFGKTVIRNVRGVGWSIPRDRP